MKLQKAWWLEKKFWMHWHWKTKQKLSNGFKQEEKKASSLCSPSVPSQRNEPSHFFMEGTTQKHTYTKHLDHIHKTSRPVNTCTHDPDKLCPFCMNRYDTIFEFPTLCSLRHCSLSTGCLLCCVIADTRICQWLRQGWVSTGWRLKVSATALKKKERSEGVCTGQATCRPTRTATASDEVKTWSGRCPLSCLPRVSVLKCLPGVQTHAELYTVHKVLSGYLFFVS